MNENANEHNENESVSSLPETQMPHQDSQPAKPKRKKVARPGELSEMLLQTLRQQQEQHQQEMQELRQQMQEQMDWMQQETQRRMAWENHQVELWNEWADAIEPQIQSFEISLKFFAEKQTEQAQQQGLHLQQSNEQISQFAQLLQDWRKTISQRLVQAPSAYSGERDR